MNSRFVLIFFALTVLLAAQSGGNASANLVRNGSFENPDLGPDNGSALLYAPGWFTASGQGLAIQGNRLLGITPADGGQWLRLDQVDSRTIYQDLPTTPNQRYRLSFAYANSPTSSISSIAVLWGTTQVATIQTSQTTFQTNTYSVVANSYSTRLTLSSVGPTDGDGDLLDSVSVTPEYGIVLPQFADGQAPNGDWKTLILFTNPHDREIRVDMVVYSQEGVELDSALRFSRILRPRETALYESTAASATVRQGWASIDASGEITMSAIYRQRVAGRPDFEAAVLPRIPTTRLVAPFDNRTGLVTSIALVNPRDVRANLDITIRNDTGIVVGTRRIPLEPKRHTSFALTDLFPLTVGARGSVEVVGRTDGGQLTEFSAIGFRFNQTGAFASLPY